MCDALLLERLSFYIRLLRWAERESALLDLELGLGALLLLSAEDIDVPLGGVADGDIL
jgi:hypothetical protein